MTTKDEVRSTVEALKLALEALEETRNALAWFYDSYPQDVTKKGNELLPHVEVVLADLRVALTSNSRALEQPTQQEPVAWPRMTIDASAPIVMTPHPAFTRQPTAQRQWVSLPDAEIDLLTNHFYHNGRPVSREYRVGIARAIEAKLREKNGGLA